MSPEWLSAAASVLTLLVVAASAVAALMQLRHMRGGNQIAALNEVLERMQSAEFRDTLRYVYRELPKLYDDPEVRKDLVSYPLPTKYEQARTVANFFENVGTFVKRGVIDGAITADMWGDVILTTWHALSPMITNRRKVLNQQRIWENYEYLAMLCQRFKDRHPDGTYPTRFPRMPESEMWTDI